MVRSSTVARTSRRIRDRGPQKIAFLLTLWWLAAAPWLVADLAHAKSEAEAAQFTWYAQTLARSQTGLAVVYFWSSGSKFRSESVLEGHKIVTIVSGNTYYAYDAVTQEGIAIQRSAAAIADDSPNHEPDAWLGLRARIRLVFHPIHDENR